METIETATNVTFAIESRGGTIPDRPGSEFVGPFQMGAAMRKQLGLTEEQAREEDTARLAFRQWARGVTPELEERGIDPTPLHIYLTWQQGLRGFTEIYVASKTPVAIPSNVLEARISQALAKLPPFTEVSAARRRNMDANRPHVGGRKVRKGLSPAEWIAAWQQSLRELGF